MRLPDLEPGLDLCNFSSSSSSSSSDYRTSVHLFRGAPVSAAARHHGGLCAARLAGQAPWA